MSSFINKTGELKPDNSHKLVLIGAPSWGVDHPFHSLVLVAGVVREADFEVNLYDFNIDFYNFVSKEDKKYWTGAYASR